jgi:clan AA aspartic protease
LITGVVVADRREAQVRLLVKGGEGRASEIEAILDTGYTEYLSLPQTMIDALLLPFVRSEQVVLSDNSIIESAFYRGVVYWDGKERTVDIESSEGVPLLGMSLLLDHVVTLPVADGATVTIAALPRL